MSNSLNLNGAIDLNVEVVKEMVRYLCTIWWRDPCGFKAKARDRKRYADECSARMSHTECAAQIHWYAMEISPSLSLASTSMCRFNVARAPIARTVRDMARPLLDDMGRGAAAAEMRSTANMLRRLYRDAMIVHALFEHELQRAEDERKHLSIAYAPYMG